MSKSEQSAPTGKVSMVVVGDMEVDRLDPASAFANVLPVLKEADLRFGGLEASMSEKGSAATGKIVMRHPPEMVSAYVAGGFDVVAFSSNHCMDYGVEPFVETMDLLTKNGIEFSGAGRNLDEARTPAIVERGGVRFGFLSYVLNLPLGWGAHATKPGVAPIREDPLFGPPYVDEEELEAMQADVVKTRSLADIVVTAFHWGSSQSRTLTLSQKAAAHAAIDAGADIVIGHHPHIIQGIEIYRGKPIFYALGNFVLDHDHPMFRPTVRESLLVKCLVEGGKIARVSFLPVLIDADGSPRILGEADAKGAEILDSVRALSAKLDTRIAISGNEAVVIG